MFRKNTPLLWHTAPNLISNYNKRFLRIFIENGIYYVFFYECYLTGHLSVV